MRQIKYNYKIVQGWIDTHPIVKFFLQGKNKSILLKGLVDTGAYYTILHKYFAYEAELDLTYAIDQTVKGICGEIKGKRIAVYLKFIDEFTKESLILRPEVIFIDNLNIHKEAVLLGRSGIFNNFKEVVFSENTNNKNIKFIK